MPNFYVMPIDKMSTKQNPTFILKGIDPNEVMTAYVNGYFTNDLPPIGKINVIENTDLVAPIYGSSSADPIYSMKDRHNNDVVFATTGHTQFDYYINNLGKTPMGGRCDACKRDFTTKVVGYPIKLEVKHVLINNPEDENDYYRTIYIFWVDGVHCRDECALFRIRELNKKPYSCRDPNLRDSENLLNMLHRLKTRGTEELKCNDPALLKSRSGSLTDEQWENKNVSYENCYRVHLIPVKREFIQHLFNQPIIQSTL